MFANEDLLLELRRVASVAPFPLEVRPGANGVSLQYRHAVVEAALGLMHASDADMAYGEAAFPVIHATHKNRRITLFIHDDTRRELRAAAARLLSVAVSLPSLIASHLYPCPWCALPLPDEGTPQPRAICLNCNAQLIFEVEMAKPADP